MRKAEGITLIALVITIILLIILAGVTISLTLGENGLFNMTQHAVDKYQNSVEEENLILADYEKDMDKYIDSTRGGYEDGYKAGKEDRVVLNTVIGYSIQSGKPYFGLKYEDVNSNVIKSVTPSSPSSVDNAPLTISVTINEACILKISTIVVNRGSSPAQVTIEKNGIDISSEGLTIDNLSVVENDVITLNFGSSITSNSPNGGGAYTFLFEKIRLKYCNIYK